MFTEKAHASGRYWCEITGAGRVIGELYEDEEDIEGPLPIRANANLIAAAPDLYEALDDALGCLSEFGYGHGPTAAKIREVLAKARGEQ